MAEKSKLKEEVKKIINSILCGYQKGATLREILSDYDLLTGCPLPLHDLGYHHLEDFLRAIPDSVITSWVGGEMVVRAVPNEKNARILDLVSRQKSAPTKSSKRGRGGSYSGRGGRGGFRSYRAYSIRGNTYHNSASFSRTQQSLTPDFVPAYIRTNVKVLMKSFTKGLLQEDFHMAFQRRYGTALNLQDLGFSSVYDFMQQLDDFIVIRQCSTGYRFFLKESEESLPPRLQKKRMKELGVTSDGDFQEQTYMEKHGTFGAPAAEKEFSYSRSRTSSHSESTVTSVTSDPVSDVTLSGGSTAVSIRVKRQIQQVLEKHPDGIWANRFIAAFQEQHGRELPFKKLGFQSLVQLMSALTDLVLMVRPSTGDWMLYDARQPPSNVTKEQKTDFDVDKSAPPHRSIDRMESNESLSSLQQNLKNLLLRHPVGIYVEDLEQMYQAQTGRPLAWSRLGYRSLFSMVTSSEFQDTVKPEYLDEGRLLLKCTEPITRCSPITAQPIPKPTPIPADASPIGANFQTLILPWSKHDPNDTSVQMWPVFVSFVESPAELWLQVYSQEHTGALEELMDELEVYKSAGVAEEYALPKTLAKVGQICAAPFQEDDNWYRASISACHRDNTVKVYYVDYGGYGLVPRDSLKLLKIRFTHLPSQAVRGRLANAHPVGPTWSQAARDLVLEIVRGKLIWALICDVNKDGVVSVQLVDTSGDTDVFVNDQLVGSGLAKFVSDEELAKKRRSSLSRETHPAESQISASQGGRAHEMPPPKPDIQSLPEKADKVSPGAEALTSAEQAMPRRNSGGSDLSSITSASEMYEEEYVRNVQYVPLIEDYSMHMIKHDDKPHVMSSELSSWFPNLGPLERVLVQRGLTVPCRILAAEQHPDIFEELQAYEVKGIDSKVKNLTLYTLETALTLLDLLDHKSRHLKEAVKKAVGDFNHEDPYWRGEDEGDEDGDDEDEEEDDSGDEGLTEENLDTALQQLSLQRKKILKLMTEEPWNVDSHVDTLDQVDRRLVDVRKRLEHVRTQDKVKTMKHTEEDLMIYKCVHEQYERPITDNQIPITLHSRIRSSESLSSITDKLAQMHLNSPKTEKPPEVDTSKQDAFPLFVWKKYKKFPVRRRAETTTEGSPVIYPVFRSMNNDLPVICPDGKGENAYTQDFLQSSAKSETVGSLHNKGDCLRTGDFLESLFQNENQSSAVRFPPPHHHSSQTTADGQIAIKDASVTVDEKRHKIYNASWNVNLATCETPTSISPASTDTFAGHTPVPISARSTSINSMSMSSESQTESLETALETLETTLQIGDTAGEGLNCDHTAAVDLSSAKGEIVSSNRQTDAFPAPLDAQKTTDNILSCPDDVSDQTYILVQPTELTIEQPIANCSQAVLKEPTTPPVNTESAFHPTPSNSLAESLSSLEINGQKSPVEEVPSGNDTINFLWTRQITSSHTPTLCIIPNKVVIHPVGTIAQSIAQTKSIYNAAASQQSNLSNPPYQANVYGNAPLAYNNNSGVKIANQTATITDPSLYTGVPLKANGFPVQSFATGSHGITPTVLVGPQQQQFINPTTLSGVSHFPPPTTAFSGDFKHPTTLVPISFSGVTQKLPPTIPVTYYVASPIRSTAIHAAFGSVPQQPPTAFNISLKQLIPTPAAFNGASQQATPTAFNGASYKPTPTIPFAFNAAAHQPTTVVHTGYSVASHQPPPTRLTAYGVAQHQPPPTYPTVYSVAHQAPPPFTVYSVAAHQPSQSFPTAYYVALHQPTPTLPTVVPLKPQPIIPTAVGVACFQPPPTTPAFSSVQQKPKTTVPILFSGVSQEPSSSITPAYFNVPKRPPSTPSPVAFFESLKEAPQTPTTSLSATVPSFIPSVATNNCTSSGITPTAFSTPQSTQSNQSLQTSLTTSLLNPNAVEFCVTTSTTELSAKTSLNPNAAEFIMQL